MAEYRFLTTWLLEADRERVWEAIYDSDSWPEWWKGVIEAERLEDGDEDGVGQLGRYVWRSKLPYKVEFFVRSTVVERPHLLQGDASRRARRQSAAGACSSRTGSRPSSTSGMCAPRRPG